MPLPISCSLQSLCCWWSLCFCCFCSSGPGTSYCCLLNLTQKGRLRLCNMWSACLSFLSFLLYIRNKESFAHVNMKWGTGLIQVECLMSVCCRVSEPGRYCQVLVSCRFLVFSDLGRTLHSILNDGVRLNEKAAFQIVVRLVRREPILSERLVQKRHTTFPLIFYRCVKANPGV